MDPGSRKAVTLFLRKPVVQQIVRQRQCDRVKLVDGRASIPVVALT